MRKFLFAILSMLMLTSLSNAEALFEIFETYGKRHMNIKKNFTDALDTEEKRWKQDGATYPHKEQKLFAFIPENECAEYWNERFTYFEFDLTESKQKLDNVNSFYAEWFTEKNRSPWCTEKILSKGASELCFEAYSPFGRPLCDKTNHMLVKIIQVANLKFTVYQYRIKGRLLSEEEKKFWFEMFNYSKVDFNKLGF